MKTQFDIRSEILLKAAYDILKKCNEVKIKNMIGEIK